jgi:acetylornithine deacetylase
VLNVGTIRGGTASNTIAEECHVTVTYRWLPGQEPHAIHRAIAERLAELDGRDRSGSRDRAAIVVGAPTMVGALRTPRGTRLEHALLDVLGARPVTGAPFATDGPELASAGIDSLICGPGDLDQAHRPNEGIDRRAFEDGPAVVREVVERLCTGTDDG